MTELNTHSRMLHVHTTVRRAVTHQHKLWPWRTSKSLTWSWPGIKLTLAVFSGLLFTEQNCMHDFFLPAPGLSTERGTASYKLANHRCAAQVTDSVEVKPSSMANERRRRTDKSQLKNVMKIWSQKRRVFT